MDKYENMLNATKTAKLATKNKKAQKTRENKTRASQRRDFKNRAR